MILLKKIDFRLIQSYCVLSDGNDYFMSFTLHFGNSYKLKLIGLFSILESKFHWIKTRSIKIVPRPPFEISIQSFIIRQSQETKSLEMQTIKTCDEMWYIHNQSSFVLLFVQMLIHFSKNHQNDLISEDYLLFCVILSTALKINRWMHEMYKF